jgi:protochlorophyllide reductase
MAWKPKDIPDQAGRTFVITGANSGIGFHAAKHLASKGATVILACRRLDAAQKAADRINESSIGRAIAAPLDLENFVSIDEFVKTHAPFEIDVLINNAGVMMIPKRITPQGHEAQWGINVVGHARLTKALLPRIKDRAVTLASIAHRFGKIEPKTWDGTNYNLMDAYAQSKLGNLMFGLRLQKHLETEDSQVKSVICHPGVSLTRLAKDVPLSYKAAMIFYLPIIQSGDKGSWPTLRAATDAVAGGSYWGPKGVREARGPPVAAEIKPHALDAVMQETIWHSVWGQ